MEMCRINRALPDRTMDSLAERVFFERVFIVFLSCG